MVINNNRNEFQYNLIIVSFLVLTFIISFTSPAFAMAPKLVSRIGFIFESLRKWIIKLATPAAAVSIAVGLFMKKFSFGDEERIRMSKKVIRGSFVSYALLLSMDMILNAIQYLVS